MPHFHNLRGIIYVLSMPIIPKILKKEQSKQTLEIDKIFKYLQSITPVPDIAAQYSQEYQKTKKGAGANFDARYIHLYLIWEDFIVTNTAIKLREQITSRQIRQEIRQKVDIDILDNKFKLVFLPETEQAMYIYEVFIQYIVRYIIKNRGIEDLGNTLRQSSIGTVFDSVVLTERGLDFKEFNKKIIKEEASFSQVTKYFKGLYTLLYTVIENTFDQDIASGFFNKIYKTLQQIYNRDIASIFLHILPEQVLGFDEWLASLSKQELERQVREKTQELEKLNNSLEEKVRERTKELQKAYDELKQLDKKKSEFISVAAHQLRTPLSGLKWTLNMMMQGELGPVTDDQTNLLKKSYETNERLITIVNDILDTDLITTGKAEFSLGDTNIRNIIDSIINEAKPNADHKNVVLKKDIEDDVPQVFESDPQKVSLVIQNLVDNAVKYSPQGETVEIRARVEESRLVLEIEDHGIGIPENQQRNIFERFYRAPNAVRVQANGSGLGLFITKNIVQMHGGKIWFKSKENKGTTFFVEIPIRRHRTGEGMTPPSDKDIDVIDGDKSTKNKKNGIK